MAKAKKSRAIAHAPRNGTGLVFYDTACRMLDKARTVDEAKEIKDQADAMRVYAKQAKNKKLEADAAEVRLRAIRKVGAMMEGQRKMVGVAKGGQPHQKRRKSTGFSENPVAATLAEAGIDKALAHKARTFAKLPAAEFENVVTETREHIERGVERNALKAVDLREARAERATRYEKGGKVADLESLIAEGKEFDAMLIDPPSRFVTYSSESGQHRSPDRWYDTMTLEEMKAKLAPLISKLAGRNCVMFIWTTGPHFAQTLELMAACDGFEYKTVAFVWIKLVRSGKPKLHWGLGHHTRANAEYCLIGIKGAPKRLDMGVHQVVVDEIDEEEEVIIAPVGKHSEKPEEVRRRIEQLYAGPYLEMFARREVKGWTTWGNEVAPPDDLKPPVDAEALADVIEQVSRVHAENDADAEPAAEVA